MLVDIHYLSGRVRYEKVLRSFAYSAELVNAVSMDFLFRFVNPYVVNKRNGYGGFISLGSSQFLD